MGTETEESLTIKGACEAIKEILKSNSKFGACDSEPWRAIFWHLENKDLPDQFDDFNCFELFSSIPGWREVHVQICNATKRAFEIAEKQGVDGAAIAACWEKVWYS